MRSAGLAREAPAVGYAVQRPKDMTQGERLDLMNRLGAKAALLALRQAPRRPTPAMADHNARPSSGPTRV
jgi:hypothetical protein